MFTILELTFLQLRKQRLYSSLTNISPAPMDTIGSCKRKIDNPVTNKKDKKEATSHHMHVLEVKTPPPIHYNK
ncbi:hypothetical protein KY290_017005 [Solanum tuberosum]|uniref:Uncharacterized protein n=1 Tax=Solanum tuberosum TaxID=4113 RepID=A0ABQ7VA40_SOLTU|nr:hypothetical protein KY284_016074 [Solanum tuberosum]KAH0760932.1 hypothetical protein KY290_017005 [Solanum tuberosum]